jgi:hypothetical protein
MADTQTIEWLRGLAKKGGKGVVNNIDARSLGRIADDLERLSAELARTERNRDMWKGQCERQADQLRSLSQFPQKRAPAGGETSTVSQGRSHD